jgi:hypothetical protein
MANKRCPKKRRPAPKAVLRLPDLDQAKSAVLNSLSSRDAQRGYRHAIDEFIEWYCSEPRLSFSRTVVVRYRMHLESRKLAPGTVNLMRTIPMPGWVKQVLDVWLTDAGITSGRPFRRVNRAGRVWGESMTEKVVWHVVREFAAKALSTSLRRMT